MSQDFPVDSVSDSLCDGAVGLARENTRKIGAVDGTAPGNTPERRGIRDRQAEQIAGHGHWINLCSDVINGANAFVLVTMNTCSHHESAASIGSAHKY